jgi:hypothetical protein
MPKWAAEFKSGNQRDYVRRYKNPNRHDQQYIYRSVTNITGALPKPALVAWAAKLTAETAVEQHESWVNMPAYEAVDWLKKAPYRNRDRAATRGTTIHGVIEHMLRGETYKLEREIEQDEKELGLPHTPWLESAFRFVTDARLRAERTETTIYDERSMTAGTFDFLGRLDSAPELGRCLIDWKTSKGVYEDMAVQLVGGYALGAQYILDDEGIEHEWKPVDTCLIVHFTAEGYAIRPVPQDKVLRRAFLGACEIRKWEDEGPPIGEPYQMRLDLDGPALANMPKDAELQHLRSRLKMLSPDKQLALNAHAHDLGIVTKLKSMTTDDYDKLLGLIGLYESGEPVPDQSGNEASERLQQIQQRRPRRPMP